MNENASIWVDIERCTGCEACLDACPVGAIAMIDDVAHVDSTVCSGCLACVDVCPHTAIQPVVEGELVPSGARPTPAVREASTIVQRVAPMVAVAGAGLVARAAGALAHLVGHWLTQSGQVDQIQERSRTEITGTGRANGRGRRARRRRRGR